MDIQLEAIHGLAYPDLVLEKVKRFPTEVTAEALAQVVQEVKEDHRKKTMTSPPPGIQSGIQSSNPLQIGGPEGLDLIHPNAWDFTEKT